MPELTPLVIFGAGGFGREVLQLIRDINAEKSRFEILGFLDDRDSLWDSDRNGVPVLGGISWLESQSRAPALIVGVGTPKDKARIVGRVRRSVSNFPVLVHPTVVRSKYIEYGTGVIVTAGNILTVDIRLGEFSTLHVACTLGHDDWIGAYANVSPGVRISGNVSIGVGCDIGTSSALVQGVSIGDWSIVGAGAVVTTSLPANCTAVGVPAKVIKQRESGWEK